jgi:hypothetical protein
MSSLNDAVASAAATAMQLASVQGTGAAPLGAMVLAATHDAQRALLDMTRSRNAARLKLAEDLMKLRELNRQTTEKAVRLLAYGRARVFDGLPGAQAPNKKKGKDRAEQKRQELARKLLEDRAIADATQDYEAERAALRDAQDARKAEAAAAKTRGKTAALAQVKQIMEGARAAGNTDDALLGAIAALQALPYVDKATQQRVLKNVELLQEQLSTTAEHASRSAVAARKSELEQSKLADDFARKQRKAEVKRALEAQAVSAQRAAEDAERAANAEVDGLIERAAATVATGEYRTQGVQLLTSALDAAQGMSSTTMAQRKFIYDMIRTFNSASLKDVAKQVADKLAAHKLAEVRKGDVHRVRLTQLIAEFAAAPTAEVKAAVRRQLAELQTAATADGSADAKLLRDIAAAAAQLDSVDDAAALAAFKRKVAALKEQAKQPPQTAGRAEAEAWLATQKERLNTDGHGWTVAQLREWQHNVRDVCARFDLPPPQTALSGVDTRIAALHKLQETVAVQQLKTATTRQTADLTRAAQDRAFTEKEQREARATTARQDALLAIARFVQTPRTVAELNDLKLQLDATLTQQGVPSKDRKTTLQILTDAIGKKLQHATAAERENVAQRAEAAAGALQAQKDALNLTRLRADAARANVEAGVTDAVGAFVRDRAADASAAEVAAFRLQQAQALAQAGVSDRSVRALSALERTASQREAEETRLAARVAEETNRARAAQQAVQLSGTRLQREQRQAEVLHHVQQAVQGVLARQDTLSEAELLLERARLQGELAAAGIVDGAATRPLQDAARQAAKRADDALRQLARAGDDARVADANAVAAERQARLTRERAAALAARSAIDEDIVRVLETAKDRPTDELQVAVQQIYARAVSTQVALSSAQVGVLQRLLQARSKTDLKELENQFKQSLAAENRAGAGAGAGAGLGLRAGAMSPEQAMFEFVQSLAVIQAEPGPYDWDRIHRLIRLLNDTKELLGKKPPEVFTAFQKRLHDSVINPYYYANMETTSKRSRLSV